MPNNNDGVICSDDHGTTPSNNNSSSATSSSFSEEETPVSKVRTLRELYESCSYAFSVMGPVTYEEAATKKEWQEAMKEEIKAIQKNKTWQLCDLPEGKDDIGLKWIFKTKFHATGTIQKHKAWLVA